MMHPSIKMTSSSATWNGDQINDYRIQSRLGRSTSSVVHRVSSSSGKSFALKVMPRNILRRQRFPVGSDKTTGAVKYITGLDRVQREIDIMRRLQASSSSSSSSSPEKVKIRPAGAASPTSALTEAMEKMDTNSKIGGGRATSLAQPIPSYTHQTPAHLGAESLSSVPASSSSASSLHFQPTSPTDSILSPVSNQLLRKGNPRVAILANNSAVGTERQKAFFPGAELPCNSKGSGGTRFSNLNRTASPPLIMTSTQLQSKEEHAATHTVRLVEVIDDDDGEEDIALVLELAQHGTLMTAGATPIGYRFIANSMLSRPQASFALQFGGNGSESRLTTATVVDGLPNSAVYSAIHDILAGIVHMHKCGIAHRDIKPENLLVSNSGRILISDFGSAEYLQAQGENGMVTHTAGSMAFWAPETFPSLEDEENPLVAVSKEQQEEEVKNGEISDTDCGHGLEVVDIDTGSVFRTAPTGATPAPRFSAYLQDMWAIGITLHCLLFHQTPFAIMMKTEDGEGGDGDGGDDEYRQRDPMDVMRDIQNCTPLPDKMDTITTGSGSSLVTHYAWAQGILEALLNKDPSQRCVATAALEMLDSIRKP